MTAAAPLEKTNQPDLTVFARLPIGEKLQTTFALHQATLCAHQRAQRLAGQLPFFGKRAVATVMEDWVVLGDRLAQFGGAVGAALCDTRQAVAARRGDSVAQRCAPIIAELDVMSDEIRQSGFSTSLFAKEKIKQTNLSIPTNDIKNRIAAASLLTTLFNQAVYAVDLFFPRAGLGPLVSPLPIAGEFLVANGIALFPYGGVFAYRALSFCAAKARGQGPFVAEMHKRLDGMEKTGKFEVLPLKMRRGLVLGA